MYLTYPVELVTFHELEGIMTNVWIVHELSNLTCKCNFVLNILIILLTMNNNIGSSLHSILFLKVE